MNLKTKQRKSRHNAAELKKAIDLVSHPMLLSLVNSLSNGIILFDASGRTLLVNPQAENYFGIKRRSAQGKMIHQIGLSDTVYTLFLKVRHNRSTRGDFECELCCLPQPGREVFLVVSAKAVVGSKKKITGYMLVARDITREKTLDRLKNEFLSISAHQLRTPLSGIKWSLQMILNEEMGPIGQDVREYLYKAFETNERMIRLVNDLLDVTRIEEGRFIYDFQSISLRDVARRVIEQLSMAAERAQVEIELSGREDDPFTLKADNEKMKLAMQNLIENSIKYSPPGGKIEIHFETVEKYGKKWIQASVKDHGIGIKPSDRVRIFSKFFRSAEAVKMSTDGTGLGLFIVKNIIEAHGGKISYISHEGQGTCFTFRLPLHKEENNI